MKGTVEMEKVRKTSQCDLDVIWYVGGVQAVRIGSFVSFEVVTPWIPCANIRCQPI
jgi:hypothetical protein